MISTRVICVFAVWLMVSSTSYAVPLTLDKVSEDVTIYPYHKDFKTCPTSIDIAYMIDGSDSINEDKFNLQKTVVKVMAYFFGVMKLGTHNGVIVFSDTARTAIKFTDHYTFDGFRDAVKALQKPSGGTRIDVALEEAHDNLFMGDGGSRTAKKIPKILVIFTDGVSGGASLDTAVQQLRNKGIIVFAVGVGDAHELAPLEQLTVRKDLVFRAADFIDLYVKAGFIARRICQHAQNIGDIGPAGQQGPDGPDGPQGQTGGPGPVGERGNMGPTGDRGFKGAKGPAGDDGAAGISGVDGTPGRQGPKGPKGERGEQGAQGPRGAGGEPGNNGDNGPRGAKGSPGASGQKGDAGEPGSNGADGVDGVNGLKGDQGAHGDVGDTGASGADGTNGATGAKGQPGADGADGETGAAGQAGQKGDQGRRGTKGARGAPGDQGDPGLNGDNGADGDPGDDGPRGPRGSTGPEGARGNAGRGGKIGIDGVDGRRGRKGTAGIPGVDSSQVITCVYIQSATGSNSASCDNPAYTAVDCGCSRGCGEWTIEDGQSCICQCNTYVPASFQAVGVNCCKLQ